MRSAGTRRAREHTWLAPAARSCFAEIQAGEKACYPPPVADHEHADIVRQLADAPDWLRGALAAPGHATSGDAAGEWGVSEIVGHVRAADAILSTRIFHMLVREAAPLPAFDDQRWGKLYAAAAIPLEDQLAHFALRRAELVAVLRALTPEQWASGGEHELAGPLTVIDLCRSIADHELEHRAQLDRVVAGGRQT